jgi:hypothetical protein
MIWSPIQRSGWGSEKGLHVFTNSLPSRFVGRSLAPGGTGRFRRLRRSSVLKTGGWPLLAFGQFFDCWRKVREPVVRPHLFMLGRDRIAWDGRKPWRGHSGCPFHYQGCKLRLSAASTPSSETIERLRHKIWTPSFDCRSQFSIGDGFSAISAANQN